MENPANSMLAGFCLFSLLALFS